MKNSKNKKLFTYMVVGDLVIALSISCKSNEEPQDIGSTISYHPSQGLYTASTNSLYPNANATVTINNDGTSTITGKAYFDKTVFQNFSITVTKWWYYYSDVDSGSSSTHYAGINGYGTEKSEVTINSPTTDYFQVSYNIYSGELSISFGPEGKRYWAGNLTKQ